MKQAHLLYFFMTAWGSLLCMEEDAKKIELTPDYVLAQQENIVIENINIILIKASGDNIRVRDERLTNIFKYPENSRGTCFENSLNTYNADHEQAGSLTIGSAIKLHSYIKDIIKNGSPFWFIRNNKNNDNIGFVILDMENYYCQKLNYPTIYLACNQKITSNEILSICCSIRSFCALKLNIKMVLIYINNFDNELIELLTSNDFICCEQALLKPQRSKSLPTMPQKTTSGDDLSDDFKPLPKKPSRLQSAPVIRFNCNNCIDFGFRCEDHFGYNSYNPSYSDSQEDEDSDELN